MSYDNEKYIIPSMDASADVDTQAGFNPHPDGSYDRRNNKFNGLIEHLFDEDWVMIELQTGKEYTFNVGDSMYDDVRTDGKDLNDSILKLMDSEGNVLDMSEDRDGGNVRSDADLGLGSTIVFAPEQSGKYYLSVSVYRDNPLVDNSGTYTISVTERPLDPLTVTGDEYNNKLFGDAGDELIRGFDGHDTLDAGAGNDRLRGGDGHDLLIGGPGADELFGGNDGTMGGDMKGGVQGQDTISYEDSPEGVSINLFTTNARGGDADGDTLGDDIEHVRGSMYADNLTGNDDEDMGNKLWGLGGDDMLDGRDGDDVLSGGGGDDMLEGKDGDDVLEGGAGADELYGGDDVDTASYSGSMMAVTVRLHNSATVGGDAEGDTFEMMIPVMYEITDDHGDTHERTGMLPDIENLRGSSGDDILAGDFRDNMIWGGDGNDKIYGGPGGGNGTMKDDKNDDTLRGEGGDDMIWGGRGSDYIEGGRGNDMLIGGPGADSMFGHSGNDTIYVDGDDVSADDTDDGRLMTHASTDNIIRGGSKADGSFYNGEWDVDTISFEKFTADDIDDLDAGEYDLYLDLKKPGKITGFENVIGSDFEDKIEGSKFNNTLEGGDSGDYLDGREGNDTVSYSSSDKGVSIQLMITGSGANKMQVAESRGGHATGDTLMNFENVTGSEYGDELYGDQNGNILTGLGGDDDLRGGRGDDTLEGGAGADELDGGTAPETPNRTHGYDDPGNNNKGGHNDTLSYASSDAAVRVNLASASVSGGHAEGDEIAVNEEVYDHDDRESTDNIDVATFESATGSMYDDSLTGDFRANTLTGLGGDDTLYGGAGSDTLIGGPGADMLDGGEERDEDEDAPPSVIDTASYNTRSAVNGVTVDLSTGMGMSGEAMGDELENIEKVMGSQFDDVFIASRGMDIVDGGAENHDLLTGLGGDGDTVSYEKSNKPVDVNLQTLRAMENRGLASEVGYRFRSQDVDKAENEADEARYETDIENVRKNLHQGFGDIFIGEHPSDDTKVRVFYKMRDYDGDGAHGDVLKGIENLVGSNYGDTLTARDSGGILTGGGGGDTLVGGDKGSNRLYGGDGNDTLTGGDGMLSENEEGMSVRVGGDDTLVGGAGDDVMTGGDGSDTFVFSPHDGNGDDVIMDFRFRETPRVTTERDVIDLRDFASLRADIMLGEVEFESLLREKAGSYILDLTDYGGGKIEIRPIILSNDPDYSVREMGKYLMEDVMEGVTDDAGIFLV